MAYLRALAEQFTDPDLSTEVVNTIVDEGSMDVGAKIDNQPMKGESYDWVQRTLASSSGAAIDAFNTTDQITSSSSAVVRPSIDAKTLMVHADVPHIVGAGFSQRFDQEKGHVQAATGQLYREDLQHLFAGTGRSNLVLNGVEHWLQRYGGMQTSGGSVVWTDAGSLFTDKGGTYAGAARPQFGEVKQFLGSNSADPSTYEDISLDVFDLLETNMKMGSGPDIVVTNSEALYRSVKSLYRDAGGIQPKDFMQRHFGMPADAMGRNVKAVDVDGALFMYADAVANPNHILPPGYADAVASYHASSAVAALSSTTFTANLTNGPKFMGFTDAYLGGALYMYDSTGAQIGAGRITAWTSYNVVEVATDTSIGAAYSSGTITAFRIVASPLLYGMRFSSGDNNKKQGLGFFYYNYSEGGAADPGAEYDGRTLAGFSAIPIGLLPNAAEKRVRIQRSGNYAAQQPWDVVRIHGLKSIV